MKIEEAVTYMSKIYLHRIIDSYIKDIIKPDESQSRERITNDTKGLVNFENVKERFALSSLSFDQQILARLVIHVLVESPGFVASEADLCEAVIEREQKILNLAQSSETFKFKDATNLATYRTVLSVALDDDHISDDEKRLLERLRTHLHLTQQDHYLLQAELQKFPKPGNKLHEMKDVKSTLVDLQKMGVIFFCNKHPKGALYALPEELATSVKRIIGITLINRAFRLLLGKLTNTQLREMLKENGLPLSGTKEERVENIISAEISPVDCLSNMPGNELLELRKSLPGVKSSSTKAERVSKIIAHFDNLRPPSETNPTDSRTQYYDYYLELASRDRQNLLSNNIISKDIDMERAFEEATTFLFESKLNIETSHQEGTEHADGKIELKNGEFILWDCKSKETIYKFPNEHLNQFKRYVRDSKSRVTCFLVIAPEIDDVAIKNAYRLKAESKTDTDLALISARDLKWLGENWNKLASGKNSKFNLEVLNVTGLLDRKTLTDRISIFL